MSAVLAVARKEIWQGSVDAFNVRLTHPAREPDLVGLPTKTRHSADSAVNESAPPRRTSVAAGDNTAGEDRKKAATCSVGPASRPAPIRPPVRVQRLVSTPSGQVRAHPQPK